MEPGTTSSVLLLGRDFGQYGSLHTQQISPTAAAAISVGSDPASPSLRFKHDPTVNNEDALLVVEVGSRIAFAVADAHFGPESSHVLLTQIFAGLVTTFPKTQTDLQAIVGAAGEHLRPSTRSETTLAVAVYDRRVRTGFGYSIGDSTIVVAERKGSIRVVNSLSTAYISTATVATSRNLRGFRFQAEPDDLIIAFTDGVNECHYRRPATSVQASDISDVVSQTSYDCLATVSELGELALAGVRSNPGGQDNIAIVAASA